MKVVWCITGAGHLLRESFDVMKKLKEHGVKITTLVSRAGEEVVKMYGLMEELYSISNNTYYEELIFEREHPYSAPITGRLSLGKYDYLISTPTTGNTVAKVVNGIADTLVTNAIAQAGKGFVKCIIVPVDYVEGVVTTRLPFSINREKCTLCKACMEVCENDAIVENFDETFSKSFMEIILSKCIGCGKCKEICQYDAIIEGKEIKMRVRKVDAKNTKKLNDLEDTVVLKNPYEIMDILLKRQKNYKLTNFKRH
ncbi:dihydromethanopterin reductase (acceptor) [Methanotorris formicicus]|uniref:Archaeoflavoprotein, MJ0208 family n=1 Tax=Methanotorris formicicus Mc-S-70 TaxID=647171 RepID=H1L060_9EURY|nr:dihydromethanopterin reductase (acceptor) [Methanotorris formicicus]EHP85194.1 archaeoflavoprotein, MJ0208 family [Methanotorris formicicus Mc-S-70]